LKKTRVSNIIKSVQ